MSNKNLKVMLGRVLACVLPPIIWLALLSGSDVMAGEDATPWKEEYSEDGRTHIVYRLSQQPAIDDTGTEPVLESRATYIGDFDLASSLALLEDLQILKIVEEVDHAELLEQISPTQRLVYFSVEGSWPIPDADSVLRLTRTASADNAKVSIKLEADPAAFEDRGLRRFSRYQAMYELEQMPDGKLKVTIDSQKTPPFKVPAWLLKTALPSAGYKQMDRLVGILEEGQ